MLSGMSAQTVPPPDIDALESADAAIAPAWFGLGNGDSGSDTHPYAQALARGHRGLRFPAALEEAFLADREEREIVRLRWSLALALILFMVFTVIEIVELPPQVSEATITVRMAVIIPALLLGLVATVWQPLRRHLRGFLVFGGIAVALGAVGVIAAAWSRGFDLPYEGLLLVAIFLYFVGVLGWREGVVINIVQWFAYLPVLALWETESQQIYRGWSLLAASIAGAACSYFFEHGARTAFLTNGLLLSMAEHDGLTGVLNRRAWQKEAARVVMQAERQDLALIVAMIDVDHFKRYNDTYGHAGGDAVLQSVAAALAGQARRPLDLVARWGGEEFVLLWFAPRTDSVEALGERARKAVADLNIAHTGSEWGCVTVSIGLALQAPGTPFEPERLLARADAALYDAKAAGRNRAVVATERDATNAGDVA